MEVCWKEYKKKFGDHEPAFYEKFRFHDSTVLSCRKKGNDLLIKIESGGFTDISQITFKSCSIIKQDAPLRGAWWLYDEISVFQKLHNRWETKKVRLIYYLKQHCFTEFICYNTVR